MTTASSSIRTAAEQAAAERRDGRLAEARRVLAGFLGDRVDPRRLTATVDEGGSVLVTDGDVMLAVTAAEEVRLAAVRDGQPTQLSEPLPDLAALADVLRGR